MSVVEVSVPEIAPERPPEVGRPSKARYVWAVVVTLVGLVASLQWSFAVLRASDAEADTFARADVPGELTVELHPGTWYVYEETGASVRDVEVTGPDGGAVQVGGVSEGIVDFKGYDRRGSTATAVAVLRIEPGEMGPYTITVTGDDEFGDGAFAVGEDDIVTFRRNQTAGILVMLLVTVGSGVAIGAGTFRRRHRPARTAA